MSDIMLIPPFHLLSLNFCLFAPTLSLFIPALIDIVNQNESLKDAMKSQHFEGKGSVLANEKRAFLSKLIQNYTFKVAHCAGR